MHTLYSAFIGVLALSSERFSSTKFWTIYKKSYSLHNGPQETAANYQNERLLKLINHARNNTITWQSDTALDLATIQSTFSEIPLSNKSTYASGFPDKVTAETNRADWQYLSSSGTTGRMTVVVDFQKRDYLRASELLNVNLFSGSPAGSSALDIPPSACNVVCGMKDSGPEPLFKYLLWSLKTRSFSKPDFFSNIRGRFERQYLLSRQILSPIDTGPWTEMCPQLDDYLDLIIANKIEVIRALPHFLLWLAIRAKQRNLTFSHVERLLPYGGLAGEELVKFVTEVFNAPYVNLYGTGEVGSIGCSSDKDTIIKLYEDMVIVEVLNKFNEPVNIGEIGKVVITDLNNYAMPIIRYEVEDVAELVDVNKYTNRPSKIKVHGRLKETYASPSGKIITPLQVQNLFFAIAGVINYKVEFLSKSLIKVTIACIQPISVDLIKQKVQDLFETKTPPIVKQTSFILPESSGKFISVKLKKENEHV